MEMPLVRADAGRVGTRAQMSQLGGTAASPWWPDHLSDCLWNRRSS